MSAEQFFRSALRLSEQDSDRDQKALVLTGLGASFAAAGHIAPARYYYSQALDICRLTDNKSLEQSIQSNLDDLYYIEAAEERKRERGRDRERRSQERGTSLKHDLHDA
ncbi:MAG: hypothetical protein HC828_17890 [Blastochloris sp.]|nr:hypothetical protein [Blastochloris sp.]